MVLRLTPISPQDTLAMENAFPQFADGDVQITITSMHRYKLHSATLRRVSPLLAKLLSEQNAKRPTKRGATIRYRLILIETDEPENAYSTGASDVLYTLKLLNDQDNLQAPINDPYADHFSSAWIEAWDKCLGAFYGKGVALGDQEDHGLNHIVENAVEIVKVATYLDCMEIVAKPVESGLLNLGQQLFLSISNSPIAWLGFACQVESKSIWREAVTHAVGQFNKETIQDALRTTRIPYKASDIVHEKADQLKAMARKLQSDLLSYYPDNLQRTKTTGRADRDSIGRASYANDIMAWLALTCWRHWLAQMVILDHTHNADDMGWHFFKCVHEAGDAYLNRVQMDQFHLYFPMSGKGQSVLENNVNQLKAHGRTIVEPALRSYCQLDIERFPVQHMTCVRVGPNDFPWLRQDSEPEEEEDEEDGGMDGATANEDLDSVNGDSVDDDAVGNFMEDVDGTPMDDVELNSMDGIDGAPMDDVDGTPMDDVDGTLMEDVDGSSVDEEELDEEEEEKDNPLLQEIRSRGMDHPYMKQVSTRRIATLGGQDIGGYFDQYGGYVYPDDDQLH